MPFLPGGPPRIPATKIVVPALPEQLVPRPHLRDRLDAATAGQIVVVSAPAGWGKTVLLADWVRRSRAGESAWVTLDDDDNDPRRFWSAVVTALLELPALSGDAGAGRLRDLIARPRSIDVVTDFVEAVNALAVPVRLVLDNVQELVGREVVRDLTRLVHHRSSGLQLVLASRADPPVGLPRLRLEDALHELRADALRFTLEDTAALLDETGLELPPARVATLHERTEGWVAGLRLAALALRRTDDALGFLAHFTGDEHSVAEYLTGEVLAPLSAETRDFLRRVSVCSPLPTALAAELSGRADAGGMLDDLRRETALIERAPPDSYRLHPLLRSYLIADLARHAPERYRELQSGAARWWFARDEPVHALRHAERAGDRSLIATLLHHWGVALLLDGDLGALRRSLAAVGPAERAVDPWLALLAALVHLDARNLPAAAAELENARRAWPEAPGTSLVALRAAAELLGGALGLDVVSSAAAAVVPTRPEVAALLHACRGIAVLERGGADDGPARTDLQQALALARAHALGYLEVQSLTVLATMAVVRGALREAAALARGALAAAVALGRHPSSWSAGATGLLAYTDLLRGDPAGAAARSAEALGTEDDLLPEVRYNLHAVHGAALADLGQRAAGLAEMRAARTEFGADPAPPALLVALAVLEDRVALLNGNLPAATEVESWLRNRVGDVGETRLLSAWAQTAMGHHELARDLAAPLHEPGAILHLPYTVVEAHLLDAEAAARAGDEPGGRAALDRAFAAAEVLDVARPFALAGPCTQKLLTARAAANGRSAFAGRVAAARSVVEPQPPVLLSEREMAVLELLPSLMSAREIAEEFTVSVNTVKSHIRAVYTKLEVTSRREAVERARESGMLP